MIFIFKKRKEGKEKQSKSNPLHLLYLAEGIAPKTTCQDDSGQEFLGNSMP